ncbi:MAG: histidine kinase [Gammaproteobacteria bacterium]|nr:histidine kinase [Gammaproteobacteria bacterium]
MIAVLRKRQLLRFKGVAIVIHVIAVSIIFAIASALVVHRLLDGNSGAHHGDLRAGGTGARRAHLPAAARDVPILQRQPLLVAAPSALWWPAPRRTSPPWAALAVRPSLAGAVGKSLSPDPHGPALEVAAITVLAYAVVIQIAVSTRRERIARQMNLGNRLKALQARIRPHFFFNTLNSVASLIRSDPEAAEKAVEDLADLFRVVIRADRRLVTLAEELEIARQYISIEKLRLGERLTVEWHASAEALVARVPSLTLQPLLENAVYHGIEPSMTGGTITVDCSCEDGRLLILVTNPVPRLRRAPTSGNQVALKNIRERLVRQFGGDVRISIRDTRDRFNISIDAPLIEARASK